MDKYTKPIWASSALLTIDMQEDFSRSHASSYVQGTDAIIPSLLKLVQYYRKQHWPVIHLVRLYKKDGSNVDACRRKTMEQGAEIVNPGSAGAELVEELKPDEAINLNEKLLFERNPQKLAQQEWILYKPRWGGFFKTGLEHLLQKLRISTVIITGCNFPNCPRATIYEASERDYRIVLVNNAVSGIYPKGEAEVRNIGASVCNTNDIIT